MKDWYIPIVYAKYVCLSNYNHVFKSDVFQDTLICPQCGGSMICDNMIELENLKVKRGEQIPTKETSK